MSNEIALVTLTPLAHGEVAAARVIEIVRVPHVCVLGDEPVADLVRRSKNDFVGMLFEVYQSYRGQYDNGPDHVRDSALELL